MAKLSLRKYFLLSIGIFALMMTGTVGLLWSASNNLEKTGALMKRSLERVMIAEGLVDDLETHHREALLKSLEDPNQRIIRREEAERRLFEALQRFDSLIDRSQTHNRLSLVRQSVERYLTYSHKLNAQGLVGNQLYVKTGGLFEAAQENAMVLIQEQRQMAFRLDDIANAEGNSYKFASAAFFGLIVIAGGLMLWLLLSALRKQNQQRLLSLSAVAHDLRNPLGAIQMSLELLSHPLAAEQNSQLMAALRRQVQRMRNLIEDLLDSTRIQSGQLSLNKTLTDLGTIIRDSVVLFGTESAKHRIGLTLPDDDIQMLGDPTRLTQVFNNLIGNAIKYSPAGGEINVSLKREGDSVLVSVADHGLGIDEKDLETIFEPFRRSHSGTGIPGLGLGLSITKKIIEAHNGSLSVSSEKGQGSRFTIELPLTT